MAAFIRKAARLKLQLLANTDHSVHADLVVVEALNDDPLAKELFGVQKFADPSQVGTWLRAQTPEGSGTEEPAA